MSDSRLITLAPGGAIGVADLFYCDQGPGVDTKVTGLQLAALAPVQSVQGHVGAVTLSSADITAALASVNPNFVQLQLFATTDATLLSAQSLHAHLEVIAAQSFGLSQGPMKGGGTAIFGATLQDELGSVNPSFPSGIAGYAQINASGLGNTAYAGFFRADLDTTSGAITGIEVDCNNNTADAVWPLATGIPMSPPQPNAVGLQSVNIGHKKGTVAVRAVSQGVITPSNPSGLTAPWLVSFYADPPGVAGNQQGVYIDASDTFGPNQSAILRNTGAGIALTMQTMGGPTVGNSVVQALDAANNVVTNLKQSGQFVTGDNINMAGAVNFTEITNTNVAANSAAAVFAASAGGTARMQSIYDGSGTFRNTGAGTWFFDCLNATGNMTFRAGAAPTAAINISSAAAVAFPAVGTTASAANAFLDNANSNNLLRSTSSLRYKKDIEPIANAADVLSLRPVWYRSTAAADRPDWSWYGLVAEEVAAVDPRLVHWSYLPQDIEDVVVAQMWGDKEVRDQHGHLMDLKRGAAIHHTVKRPKTGAKLVPDAVMYDRVAVMLLGVVQKHEQRLKQLETGLKAAA